MTKINTNFFKDFNNAYKIIKNELLDIICAEFLEYISSSDTTLEINNDKKQLTHVLNKFTSAYFVQQNINSFKESEVNNIKNYLGISEKNYLNKKFKEIRFISSNDVYKNDSEIESFTKKITDVWKQVTDLRFRTFDIFDEEWFTTFEKNKYKPIEVANQIASFILDNKKNVIKNIKEKNNSLSEKIILDELEHFIDKNIILTIEKYFYTFNESNVNFLNKILDNFLEFIEDDSLIIFNVNVNNQIDNFMLSLFNNENFIYKIKKLSSSSIIIVCDKPDAIKSTILNLYTIKIVNHINDVFNIHSFPIHNKNKASDSKNKQDSKSIDNNENKNNSNSAKSDKKSKKQNDLDKVNKNETTFIEINKKDKNKNFDINTEWENLFNQFNESKNIDFNNNSGSYSEEVELDLEDNFVNFNLNTNEVKVNHTLKENVKNKFGKTEEEIINYYDVDDVDVDDYEKYVEDRTKANKKIIKNKIKKNILDDNFEQNTFDLSSSIQQSNNNFDFELKQESITELIYWKTYFRYFIDLYEIKKNRLELSKKSGFDNNKYEIFKMKITSSGIKESYLFLKSNEFIFKKMNENNLSNLFILELYALYLHIRKMEEYLNKYILMWKE